MSVTVTAASLTQAGLAVSNIHEDLSRVVVLLAFQGLVAEFTARARDVVALEAYAARLESLSLFAEATALRAAERAA
jgi:hypothetical protein